MLTSISSLLIILLGYASKPIHCSKLAVRSPNVDWTSIIDSRGHRLPDFSFCGYHNSDIPLPTLDRRDINISLPGRFSDDLSPAIQQAIDTVAQSGGGVVRLPPGKMSITAGIQLRNNVIVTGSGESATTLVLKRQPSKPVFTLGRLGTAPKAVFGFKSKITNTYLPVGVSTVNVTNSTGFTVGQNVYVSRAAQESWIRYNGMSDLVRDGVPQEWIPVRSSAKRIKETG